MTEDTAKDDSDILIDSTKVGSGLYLIRQNAIRTFSDAKFLYDNHKFQNAIPLFIISLEESLKAHELSIKFRKNQSIDKTEWKLLRSHKHKLTHVSDFVIENIESMDKKMTEEVCNELGIKNMPVEKNEMLYFLKAEKGIESHFQKIKELCLYQNWNEEFDEWDEFDNLNPTQKEDLAYYIMKRAELHLFQLDAAIEMGVYTMRRDGYMIENLEFPSYNEIRKPEDFETRKNESKIIKDYLKHHRGLKILEFLLVKKAFGVVDQLISNTLFKNCLKKSPVKNVENWNPHPLIKSVYNALAAMREYGKDGTFAGLSGDADLTYEGKPQMTTMTIISKKKDVIKIEKIMINSKEYFPNDKIIEQILQTEPIIESVEGDEISLEKTHQAFAKIGLKLRKLKDSEIESAIKNAISLIEEGKVVGMSDETISKIKMVTKKNWDDQTPEIRSSIGTLFGSNIIKDQNTYVTTGYYDPLEKFKVRGMIYKLLLHRNSVGLLTTNTN